MTPVIRKAQPLLGKRVRVNFRRPNGERFHAEGTLVAATERGLGVRGNASIGLLPAWQLTDIFEVVT